jgi:predicted O-linked N-acetylglucosamine transferase (SPINDLY family)
VLHSPIQALQSALDAHQKGDLTSAEAAYRRILATNARHAGALHLLGTLMGQRGDLAQAESYIRAALAIEDNAAFHANLGLVLAKSGQLTEAEVCYRNAIRLKPDYLGAYEKLISLLRQRYRHTEAESALQAAWCLDQNNVGLLSALHFTRRMLCMWDNYHLDCVELSKRVRQGAMAGISPFDCLSTTAISPIDQRNISEAFATQHFGSLLAAHPAYGHHGRGHDRLRIGYLSANMHANAMARLITGIFESHDRSNFSIAVYSYGPDVDDPERLRVRAACELFRDLSQHDDESAARIIAADEADILVDVMGYTEDMRLGIIARRPAPVIVSWLGYPGSLGHPLMADYIIGDPVVTPIGHASHYSETLALMPHAYQPNDRLRVIGTSPTRSEAGLPQAGLVFCNFNQTYKFSPETFSLWCRLLDALPGSVLWLLESHPVAHENLRKEARARGVNPARLIFAPLAPYAEHLGRLRLADLALDTYPYTSHTTGSDALWAGVPMVTRIGETFASRVAASLLHAAGLPELVVQTDDEYFERVLSLARQPERLAALRSKLAAQRLTCPLFDTERFTRDLERLYQAMWSQHLSGGKAPIVLQP